MGRRDLAFVRLFRRINITLWAVHLLLYGSLQFNLDYSACRDSSFFLRKNFNKLLLSLFLLQSAAKLWEKGDMKLPSGNNGPLQALQLPGGPDNQVWRDSTWSTQGFETNSGGILRYDRMPIVSIKRSYFH